MNHTKLSLAALFAVALAVAVPVATAQTVEVQATGSSGVFLSIGQATFNDVAGGHGSAHIWTAKGNSKCTGTNNCASIHDGRSGSIPDSQASVWVVWDSTATHVWTYTQVDTIVGNRAFFATPRAKLVIDGCATAGTCPGQQLIPSAVLGGQTDETSIPVAVYNAINNVAFTALFTELRPEDAAQAQTRVVNTLTANLSGLGYGTGPNTLVGQAMLSAYDSATAVPVAFKIKGQDPFTHKTVPAYSSQNLGAYPVVFISNRSNASGLGLKSGGNFVYTDLNDQKNTKVPARSYMLQRLYGGDCETKLINPNTTTSTPVNLLLREPLSGTYTTTEYTEVRNAGNTSNSQEKGIGQPVLNTATNPPNALACTSGGGTRTRGIGTGEVLKGNGKGVGGVLNTSDSLAYFFWSFANGAPFAGNPSTYGYFTLDGVDPLQTTYVDGTVPSCTAPCPVGDNTSFPHLRDGTYRSWTIVRVVGAAGDAALQALVDNAQCDVNKIEPDFVPWTQTNSVCSGLDTGLGHYRSHFTADGIAASNVPEAGGDVGGVIFANPPDNLAIHLNKRQ